MNDTLVFEQQTKELIDDLKGICANYGLGNDGNEFKIITQVFLYKFINDKFAYEVKKADEQIAKAESWEEALAKLSADDYEMLTSMLPANTAKLKPKQFISHLAKQANDDFADLFDNTLIDIAAQNNDIFSIKTAENSSIVLFEAVSKYIIEENKRDLFCKAIIGKLIGFSFEKVFEQKYDFFATIFEYLIKDYNKDGGGKYAEYYTPHAVAKIIAAVLVTEEVKSVTCYDPAAGSGRLLMDLAHEIGDEKCTLYSQDISQKSTSLLRLNLILNNLVHSIQNITQGNTMLEPFFKEDGDLMKFDYIVSNPPFKLDFSDFRNDLDTKENSERFAAGIPNIPNKAKDKMAIYSLFIQHIMYSLNDENGKAAIVVPTGFITAQTGIDKRIRQKLVAERWLSGVISMPSNIFATTGTNVSILFLDKGNKNKVVLMDASGLGEKVKEGKNQKTVLAAEDEQHIIDTYNKQVPEDDFSVVVSYEEIAEKNYSLSAGQYFEVKIEYVDITKEEFEEKMKKHKSQLTNLFDESLSVQNQILKSLESLKYEN